MAQATAAQNLEQADKRVLEAFGTGARGYIAMYQDVFMIEEPERRDERFVIVKTDSAVQEVTDGAAYPTQSVSELGANTISVKVFKSAIEISDLAELFDNYGKIAETAQTRGYHFKAKMDAIGADFLNNATSTSSPYGINIAGTNVALVGTTQPIGDSGSTQSNRITGNLDKTTLNSARVAMRKMKDHDGMIAAYQARRLVVPSEEVMNAWQISTSAGEPESANRNDNYIKTLGLQVIEWPLLSSTTGCFLLADKSNVGCKGLRYEVKEMPTMRRILNPVTGLWQYQFRMVLNAGLIDYLGCVSIGV
jgi:hypothetical protein